MFAFALAAPASAQTDQKPQYGGSLEVGTVYVTLSALSFDPADWNWKLNHDTGNYLRAIVRRRPVESPARNGGKYPFYADAYLPSDAIRGELAESWEWKQNPLRVEINLRKGVMFPDKPGVMAARELVADDVVFSLQPPRQEPEEDGRLFRPSRQGRSHRHAHRRVQLQELQRRVGLPLRLGLLLRRSIPKEVADAGAGNWKNVNGTGPFMLDRLRAGQFQHLRQEPELLGQGEDRRRRVQAAVRRQGRLSHHQGRGDLPHRAAHRQARHSRKHPLVGGRRAEKERAAAAVVEMAQR